jgi:hypothetical protein
LEILPIQVYEEKAIMEMEEEGEVEVVMKRQGHHLLGQ